MTTHDTKRDAVREALALATIRYTRDRGEPDPTPAIPYEVVFTMDEWAKMQAVLDAAATPASGEGLRERVEKLRDEIRAEALLDEVAGRTLSARKQYDVADMLDGLLAAAPRSEQGQPCFTCEGEQGLPATAKGEDTPKVPFPIAHCSNPKCDNEFSMEHMALGLPGVAWQCPKCYGRDYHCEVTIAAKGEEPREPSRVGFSALGRALGAVKPGEGKRWSAAELTRVCELLATESLPLEPGREALDAFMDAMRSVCLANEPDMIGRQERLCEEWNVRVTEPKE